MYRMLLYSVDECTACCCTVWMSTCMYCLLLYSVDEYWHVPHFEKMLYDNPQLASTYLAAFQVQYSPTLNPLIPALDLTPPPPLP